jgi:hypothetical protein
MFREDARSTAQAHAQAHAQAVLTTLRSSNARTYARDLQRTTYLGLETYVSNARRGAEENWPQEELPAEVEAPPEPESPPAEYMHVMSAEG